MQVHALAALGRLDDAPLSGDDALDRLGQHVPHARSLVLARLADALHEAGRIEDAYEALSRSAALEQRTTELEELQEQFREQADRDPLTGLRNRRYLARQLDLVTRGAEQNFSLAVLDLDHFKQINDTHGHDVGDQVLIRVSGLLLDVLRRSDVLARTGGEEFGLFMPHSDAGAAIRQAEWSAVAAGLAVTASAGIARSGEALGLDRIAALADRRLYDAKRLGRDRAVSGTV